MNNNVKAKFAYFYPAFADTLPTPSYLILKSDCPSLPETGNVGANQLTDAGVPVPPTPSYETWQKNCLAKLRCARCYSATRGPADLERHLELVHGVGRFRRAS